MIKVQDNKSLSRDPNSKAIINTDKNAFERARHAKLNALKDKEKINNLETEVKEIKNTMNEILNILKKGDK